jgi:hypothetical protein
MSYLTIMINFNELVPWCVFIDVSQNPFMQLIFHLYPSRVKEVRSCNFFHSYLGWLRKRVYAL